MRLRILVTPAVKPPPVLHPTPRAPESLSGKEGFMTEPMRRSLLNRDFRLYLSGRLISELGSRITREDLPITAVLAAHASAQDLGWMAAAGYIAALGASPLAGVLSDRMRRRPILVAADLLRALLLGSITLAAVLGRLTFAQMLIVFGLVTGVGVFFGVADQAWLPGFAGREHLEPANAALSGVEAIGEAGGPALMGVLVQTLGGPFALLIDAASYCASAASLLLIGRREPAPEIQAVRTHALQEAVQGLRAIMRHEVLRPFALSVAVQSLGGGFFAALYEFYALRVLQLSPLAIGGLVTAGGIGSLLGAALAPRLARRLGTGPSLIAGAILSGALAILVPLAPSAATLTLLFLITAQFLGDAAGTVFQFGEVVVRQSTTPDGWLGRVSGAVRFLENALGALGAVFAGSVAVALGSRGALYVGSVLMLLSSALLLRRAVVGLRRPPEIDVAHFSVGQAPASFPF